MSKINGYHANIWIAKNHPVNGLFRVYWKDIIDNDNGGATLNSDEGEGLRYEWYYKNGKKDGTSRGWYPNGQLKHKVHWKDGKAEGLSIEWHENGQKRWEATHKNGKENGLRTEWYENGQKRVEGIYKDDEVDGVMTFWYKDGQKTDKL